MSTIFLVTSFSLSRLHFTTAAILRAFASRRALFFAILLLIASSGRGQQPATDPSPVRFTQGDPTNGEQYLLQCLNRARMDPVGEGQRLAAWLRDTPAGQSVVLFYGSDPDQVASDFAVLPAVPPLAFNPDLIASARAHSADLAPHDGLGPGGATDPLNNHLGYDGSTPDDRVTASGFRSADGGDGYMGECFDPGSASLDETHAGYLVDWGNPDLGHRKIEMAGSEDVNVVGIGLAMKPTSVDTAFPLVETEDYGGPNFVVSGKKVVPADVPAQLVGVVYADANANGQYNPGEGVAGVAVTMDNGFYYTVTSASGGYALPLVNTDGSNADGPVNVHMIGLPGGVDCATTITVENYQTATYGAYRANVEWDGVADTPPAANATEPTVRGGGLVFAGSKIKLKVARPASSNKTQPVTVAYKVKGTAVAGVDYAALPGTVTIPAGETTATIKVTALGNSVLNGPAGTIKLVLKLKGVSGAQGKATVTFMP